MHSNNVDAVAPPPGIVQKPAMVLNRQKLEELRKANGITTETALAAAIGISTETLWRASKGDPISSVFMARMKLAFPHTALDSMFEVVQLDSFARAS